MVEIRYNKKRRMMEVIIQYNEGFIEELKKCIHYPFRKWSPDDKVWLINVSQRPLLVSLIEKWFPNEEILFLGEFPQTYRFQDDNEYYELLEVRPDCCNEILESAFKTLCKKYHPDLNKEADVTSIREIYNAHDELKRIRGIK